MKKFIIIYFFFLLFILSFFSSGVVESLDGLQYLAVARNIYYKHEPVAPTDEYGTANGWKNIYMSTYVGRNGKTYTLTGLGFSLAMVPSVAVADLFYKIYNVAPPLHFPLQNDWIIFLTTSFVNVFFASIFGVVMYLYLKEVGVKLKTALLISLLSIFTTNLFAFSKHITAHMMFTTILFTSFYLMKKYFNTKRKIYLYFSGLVFGALMITYNNTFMLSMPALSLYYLLLLKPKINLKSIKPIAKDILLFLLGAMPFIFIYYWFENVRAPVDAVLSSPTFLLSFAKNRLLTVPITLFFEGLWGQLFSPGRSIFIYSPLLLVVIFFWFKLKKEILPETYAFVVLSITYIVFYSSLYLVGTPEQGFAGLWPGESSWGPRYIAPLIPLGMVLVGYIYQKISKLQKLLVILPLCLIGFYIEILGITMPYQIKYHYLDQNFYVNNNEYNVYAYVNLLPRYSPIIMQTKNLFRLIRSIPAISNPGPFNVKMYDGINFAFDVGPERWRVIQKVGYISFDNDNRNPIKDISFDLINHPLNTTKKPLYIDFEVNGQKVLKSPQVIAVGKRQTVHLDLSKVKIADQNNQIKVIADYKDDKIYTDNDQLPALINMHINNITVNKEYINVPYVTPFGPEMTGVPYKTWGGTNPDPWNLWDLHTQTFERLPDFWWARNLYYWDVPKKSIITLLVFDVIGISFFGFEVFRMYRSGLPKK